MNKHSNRHSSNKKASKSKQSKSRSRRKITRSSSSQHEREDIIHALDERIDQRKNHQRYSSTKRERSSSRRTSSTRVSPKASADITGRRRNARTRPSRRKRSFSKSSRTSRTASDSSHSRSSAAARLDDSNTNVSFVDGSDSIPDLSSTMDSSVDTAPGAFRVDMGGQISQLSSMNQQIMMYDSEDSDINSETAERTRTASGRSRLPTSWNHYHQEETTIEAVVAQDYAEEIEEARQRGRREAIQEVSQRDTRAPVAIAVAREDDEARKRRKLCFYVMLLGLLPIAIGVTVTILLFRSRNETPAPFLANTETANAKIVVVYNPPSLQECQAIANGTILVDQQALIHKSFDIYMDVTLTSDTDLGLLLMKMLGYIQQKLIPIMAGCGAIGFFDTNLVVADGLKNATNSILNGQVQSESQQTCKATASDGTCRSYVLVLDLCLKDEQSTAKLIEVIGNAIDGETIANLLVSEFPVGTVLVPWIVPSDETKPPINDVFIPDSDGVVPTEIPTPNFAQLPVEPTIGLPPTLNPTRGPSMFDGLDSTSLPTITAPYQAPSPLPDIRPNNPQSNPTIDAPSGLIAPEPMTSTAHPSTRRTQFPTMIPTVISSTTRNPTKPPSVAPAMAIGSTVIPNPLPIIAPSVSPSISTPSPSTMPTLAPSPAPSDGPSFRPSSGPSPLPSFAPTASPTVGPISPTPTAGSATLCCSHNYKDCDVVSSYCQTSQYACEMECTATWIQANTCTGLVRWATCTYNEDGCCAPAVCTGQGPGYKQCI